MLGLSGEKRSETLFRGSHTTKSGKVTLTGTWATPTATTEPLVVSGDGYFKIDNQTTSVDVVVKIYFAGQGEEQQGG